MRYFWIKDWPLHKINTTDILKTKGMKNSLNPLYSTPTAILVGCLIVAISILIHGGYIKVGKLTGNTAAPSAAAPAGQPAAKTESQIIASLKDQAKSLGLNTAKFNSCLDSGEKASLVKADLDAGTKVGVNGTPAFFVNGRTISGAVPFDQFKTIIDEELSGTAAADVKRETVEVGDLPLLGSQTAKVTLIEFSDYQCPFCGRHFTQTERTLKKEYVDSGKVKFYYRDFPLSQIHPGAQKGAEAARCAGDQGKYWQYHDLVFQNQSNIF